MASLRGVVPWPSGTCCCWAGTTAIGTAAAATGVAAKAASGNAAAREAREAGKGWRIGSGE